MASDAGPERASKRAVDRWTAAATVAKDDSVAKQSRRVMSGWGFHFCMAFGMCALYLFICRQGWWILDWFGAILVLGYYYLFFQVCVQVLIFFRAGLVSSPMLPVTLTLLAGRLMKLGCGLDAPYIYLVNCLAKVYEQRLLSTLV